MSIIGKIAGTVAKGIGRIAGEYVDHALVRPAKFIADRPAVKKAAHGIEEGAKKYVDACEHVGKDLAHGWKDAF